MLTDKENKIVETLADMRRDYAVSGSGMNASQLLDLRDRISIWNSSMGELVARWEEMYMVAEQNRKLMYETRKKSQIESGTTVSAADNDAALATDGAKREEIATYAIYKRLKLLHEDYRDMSQAISQRVATLRSELVESRQQSQT